MKNFLKAIRGGAFVVFVLALFVVTFTSGCASMGYGAITKNLADNGAITIGKFGTPWGVQELTRVGETTNTVLLEPPGGGRIWINPPVQIGGNIAARAPQQTPEAGVLPNGGLPRQQSVVVPWAAIQEAMARQQQAQTNGMNTQVGKPALNEETK